jgi:MFS family permease
MPDRSFSFHTEFTALANAPVERVFAHLDDPKALSAHMGESSMMMLGSRMSVDVDTGGGQAIGSIVRMHGSMMGIPLSLEEVITEREVPHRKAWETIGTPNLKVIAHYRMGFELKPCGDASLVRVFIDYSLPAEAPGSWLGDLLGGVYARWCAKQVAEDAAAHFDSGRPADIAAFTMAALMLAVFTVSIGFGVVPPFLPDLIERLLGAAADAGQVSRHTGLLTAVYTFALFLSAPLWGRLSDRLGARGVLLVGLGFGVTMMAFSLVESLAEAYAERFLNGLFSAAVVPVAAAAIGNFSTTEQGRARRLAFVSIAGIAGLLLGPMLGVLMARIAADLFALAVPAGAVAIPLAATAMLAGLVATVVAFAVPAGNGHDRLPGATGASHGTSAWLVQKLLILTFIASAGIGVLEVGLALRGRQELGLTPYQIALMFTECSLVMFVMQAIVFAPRFKPETTRWLIAPALAVLAAGLFLLPFASDFALTLFVVGAVAASAGILSPILTYWISAKAGSAQGWQLGRQTAAASLGVTLGSAAGGLLYSISAVPSVSFVLAAGLAVLGLLLSFGLPHLLTLPDSRFQPHPDFDRRITTDLRREHVR